MPRVLEIAMQTAISRRGVAVVALPGDVAMREAVHEKPRVHFPDARPTVCPSEDELNLLADLLNRSERITILGGAGCAGAHDELVELAGKLQAPIVHAMRGKEFIEYDNPFDVGMTGLLGFSSGYHAMMNCDVLLMIGTDFPVSAVLSQGRHHCPDRPPRRAARTPGQARLRLRRRHARRRCAPFCRSWSKTEYDDAFEEIGRALSRGAQGPGRTWQRKAPAAKPIHPQYVARVLDRLAADDAVFTCDVGTPTIWAARYLTMNGKRRIIGSFNHGSMANALPQAIGAQVSHPGRQVISLSGDGGLAMLMGDLLTLRQQQLPVKVIVFKNESLAFVELEMKASGILDFSTDLRNPDFTKIAEGSGLLGLRAATPDQVEPMIAQALKYDGPALVEVPVSRQELSMPPTITIEQAKGFSLFMLKAVLNGRGDEVVDLAKVNLFR